MSKLGLLSRAQATDAILAGRVRVAGRVVRRPSMLVTPEFERIEVDGRPARQVAWRTILFHKPRGVMTTRSDPDGRPTIYDVLGEGGAGLVAVGRLDFATSGLLLLTSDTQLANWLADPANEIPRLYVVTVRGRMTPESVANLSGRVMFRKASSRESHLLIELSEGKNRQVRRMFAAAGHEVTALKRVRFGGLELGSLAPGAHREILRKDIANAFPG
ncbi:MAG TPA: pseudouridine synthase, partial [Vicinamibacterales bacterium]|nr:pseudouridine synthase [Vicinamibacterales bacterium]